MADTLREHISWTQIQMYLRCSMQYHFRYVLGMKEAPNVRMVNGKAGHEALEENSKHKIENKEDQSTEQILDNFATAFDREILEVDKKEIRPDETPDATKDKTVQSLTVWRAKYAPLVTPLAVELEFTIPIEPTEQFHEVTKPIQGKIDTIEEKLRTTNSFPIPVERKIIKDYKFPNRLPGNLQDLADMNDQLTIYDYGMMRAGKTVDELAFEHLVPPTKTLPSRIIETIRSPAIMTPTERARRHDRLLFKIRQVTRAIREGIFVPVDDPKVCNSCGFKRICQYSLADKDYAKIQIAAKGHEPWQPADATQSASQLQSPKRPSRISLPVTPIQHPKPRKSRVRSRSSTKSEISVPASKPSAINSESLSEV